MKKILVTIFIFQIFSAMPSLLYSQDKDAEIITNPEYQRSMADAMKTADVFLHVPVLRVDQITLDVQNLFVHLSLDARLANLLQLTAGADAKIDKVTLDIKGVKAQALLIVRLHNVKEIINRTLETLDKNPQIVEKLLSTVDNTVNNLSGVLNQTVNTLGQTVQTLVDPAGNIIEKTLDNTGNILNQNNLGSILSLPVVNETTNSAGQVVKQFRHSSGLVIEGVFDSAGNIISTKTLNGR